MNSGSTTRTKPGGLSNNVAADAVMILDVFSKKTTTTPKDALTNCKRRLAAYIGVAAGAERKKK